MALFDKKPTGDLSAPLTLEQVQILLNGCYKRKPLKAMMLLALYGGISMPEVLKLQKSHLDFTYNKIKFLTPVRELEFPLVVITALGEALDANSELKGELVFPYSERVVQKTLNDLGLGTLGFVVSWSTLRKTWAVLCFKHGIRIESMITYSQSTIEALAKWAVYGRPGKNLPQELIALHLKTAPKIT